MCSSQLHLTQSHSESLSHTAGALSFKVKRSDTSAKETVLRGIARSVRKKKKEKTGRGGAVVQWLALPLAVRRLCLCGVYTPHCTLASSHIVRSIGHSNTLPMGLSVNSCLSAYVAL